MKKRPRQLKFRAPENLLRSVRRAAKINNRSMNSEIIQRLMDSFAQQDREELISAVVKKTLASLRPANSLGQFSPSPLSSLGNGIFNQRFWREI